MAIENGSPEVVLPAELKKRVEAVRQQITKDEAHIVNLKQVRAAEEYAIRQSVKEKEQLTRELEALKQEVEQALFQANECRLDIFELEKKRKYKQAEVGTLDEEIAQRRAWNDEREDSIRNAEKALAKREAAVEVKERNVNETKRRVDILHEKVSQAVKEF